MAFTPFVETDRPTMAAFNQKFLDAIDEAVEEAHKIEVGSYVGTGTYGQNNPNTLMFGFKPKIIIVQAVGKDSSSNDNSDDPHGWGLMLTNRLTSTFQKYLGMGYEGSLTGGNLSSQYGKIDGNTVSWYSNTFDNQVLYQLNTANVTYQYIAIG